MRKCALNWVGKKGKVVFSIFSILDTGVRRFRSDPIKVCGILDAKTFQPDLFKVKNFGHASNSPKSLDYDASEGIFLPSISSVPRKFSKALHRNQRQSAEFIFDKFKNMNGLTIEIGNHMLLACANTGNSKFAREICRLLQGKGISLNEKSYALFLKSLCKDGLVEEAVQRLGNMIKLPHGLQPNIIMFNIVLNGCASTSNKDLCDQCLDMMKNKEIELDNQSYAELIRLQGNLKDYKMIETWWRIARSKLPSSIVEHNARIIALSKTKFFRSAIAALHEFALAAANGEFDMDNPSDDLNSKVHKTQKSVRPELADPVNRRSRVMSLSSEVDSLYGTESKKDDDATKGFHGVVKSTVRSSNQWWEGSLPDRLNDNLKEELITVYNAVINAVGKEGSYSLASQLVSEMLEGGLQLNHITFSAYLHAAGKSGSVKDMLNVWQSMNSAGIQPTREIFEVMIHGFCKGGLLEDAKDLLNQMHEKGDDIIPTCHAYNALLQAYAEKGEIDEFMETLTAMKSHNIKPDICTYLVLFAICPDWTKQDVKLRIEAIESDMKEEGIKHTCKSFNSMINVMGRAGMIKDILERIRSNLHKKDAEGNFLIDTFTYNTAISACIKSSQMDLALLLFDELQKKGLRPDLTTYNILIDGCAQTQKIDEAFSLADSLYSRNLNPDIITFNTLIKAACTSGKVNMALKLLEEMEMENSKVPSDQISYATILSSAVYNNKLGVVEYLLERMHRRGLPPTIDICKLTVEAYSNAQRQDDAVEALGVLSHRMKNPSKLPFSDAQELLTPEVKRRGEALNRKKSKEDEEEVAGEKLNLKELLEAALKTTDDKQAADYFSRLSAWSGSRAKDWRPEDSPWARRLRALYDHRQKESF